MHTAVKGSKAPRIAVGVEPMILSDFTVKTRDRKVGTNPKTAAQKTPIPSGSGCKEFPGKSIEKRKINTAQQESTYKFSFKAPVGLGIRAATIIDTA